MTKSEKSTLLGIALGDGYIRIMAKRTGTLELQHCGDQADYVRFKRDILVRILKCKAPNIREYVRKDDGHAKACLTKTHRYFFILRKFLYKNGKKYLSKHVLNRLTDEAVALWFMDDSGIRCRRNAEGTRIKSYESILSICCPLDQAERVIDFFTTRYEVTPKLKPHRTKRGGDVMYYSVRFNTGDMRKLFPKIRPFACKSMLYKFPDLKTGLVEAQRETSFAVKDEDIVRPPSKDARG